MQEKMQTALGQINGAVPGETTIGCHAPND